MKNIVAITLIISFFVNFLYGKWIQTPCDTQGSDCTLTQDNLTDRGMTNEPNQNNTIDSLTINQNVILNNRQVNKDFEALITVNSNSPTQINTIKITNNGTIGYNIKGNFPYSIRNFQAENNNLESQIDTLINNGTINGNVVNYTTIKDFQNNGALKMAIINPGTIQKLTHVYNSPITVEGIGNDLNKFPKQVINLILGNNTTINFKDTYLTQVPTFQGTGTIGGNSLTFKFNDADSDITNNNTSKYQLNLTNQGNIRTLTNSIAYNYNFVNDTTGTITTFNNSATFQSFTNKNTVSTLTNQTNGSIQQLTNQGT
ncbi:hypothetical protein OQH62_08150, partial [Campylobacter sp. MIT 21-1684]